jgi:hypothetical protein
VDGALDFLEPVGAVGSLAGAVFQLGVRRELATLSGELAL